MLCRTRSLLVALLLTLWATAALSAPLDKAANTKIDEAINKHYLATSFNKAESLLLGTLKACGDRCSASVMARGWMYVGIVRGSGKNDVDGARKAFEYAVHLDEKVKLDAALATPETKAAYRKAKASGGTPPPADATAAPTPSGPAGAAAATEPASAQRCTPRGREVQTRRPIPMQCTAPPEASRGEIRFKAVGGDKWQGAAMVKHGGALRGTIPCHASMLAGSLEVHILLLDAGGDVVDTIGTRHNPLVFQIQAETTAPPPAFPDQPPPSRCSEEEECPPDFPGCKTKRGDKSWGDACSADRECQSGLACVAGKCEEAQSCKSDADCTGDGVCVGGFCESGEAEPKPFIQNWFGLHVAQDIVPVGGTDVCSVDSQANDDYACYYNGAPFPGSTLVTPGLQGKVNNGMVAATTRFLASYERAFTENIAAGARLGFAIGGGPATLDGTSFMPFHGELRASYYLLGLRTSFRPYVGVAGGIAQVDTKISNVYVAATPADLANPTPLEVWKKTGQSFGALNAGAALLLADNIAGQLNINAMLLFPSSGISIQPSLGVIMGL